MIERRTTENLSGGSAHRPKLILRLVERIVAAVHSAAQPLVLPLTLLLFLQWPLRELLHAYSRDANDLAQILFALYVGVAVSAATRERAHLSVDVFARRYSAQLRSRLTRAAQVCVLIPWSAFLLYAGWPLLRQSLGQLEAFPETTNPGYFIIKFAAWLLALLVLLQAVLDAARKPTQDQV
jgi:TRAP-type C4-dicarboxylate transport system permease small subunit